MTDDDDHGHWVTDDPGLIVMVNIDNPQCGVACLPLSEWAPLVERIVKLEAALTRHRELLSQISALASQQSP